MLGKITRKTEKEMSPPYLLSKATPWQYALLTTGCADPKGNFVFPYDEGMFMSTMAVLVDGGFYLKRARNLKGAKTPRARAKELVDYCRAHVKHEGAELYRIFYYDCDPIAKKVYHPLHNRTFDQSKTDDYAWKMEFFAELANKRKLAIRKGQPLEGSGAFVLKSDVSKCIVRGERDVESLTDDDFVLDVQQKGVDVRIGLDVALISLNRYADQIVLITGDSDFVPAAKFARRNGVDFILDPMWHPFRPELGEHVDGMYTPWANPAKVRPKGSGKKTQKARAQ